MSMRHLGVFSILCGLFFGTAAQATPIGNGLLGYWQFNGRGADSSGNGNTVTLNGSATYGTGLFGQALSLNGAVGTNASMTTNNTAFDFGSNDFTIQVWANFNSVSSEQTLLEKFTGGSGPGWTLTTPGGNSIQFYANGGSVFLDAGETIPTGKWQQFVVTRVGNVFDLYWDDMLISTETVAHTLSGTTNPLLFGARNTGDGRNFTLNGLEDEVAIWDRGLSAADIASLWNDGAGEQIPTSVPEPASGAILAGALSALLLICLRQKRVVL